MLVKNKIRDGGNEFLNFIKAKELYFPNFIKVNKMIKHNHLKMEIASRINVNDESNINIVNMYDGVCEC